MSLQKRHGRNITETTIAIFWDGPFTFKQVITFRNDGGIAPKWDGQDYGLYQVYAEHILNGPNTLVYIGKAVEQTFAQRFRQHGKEWLAQEKDVKIFLGRINDGRNYSVNDSWKSWKHDVGMAEEVLIYKYTPNYNSSEKGDYPNLKLLRKVKLIHHGRRCQLEKIDIAPKDYL